MLLADNDTTSAIDAEKRFEKLHKIPGSTLGIDAMVTVSAMILNMRFRIFVEIFCIVIT